MKRPQMISNEALKDQSEFTFKLITVYKPLYAKCQIKV